MTTRFAIKALQKYAKVTKDEQSNVYRAVHTDKSGRSVEISFHDQNGSAICLHTCPVSQVADSQSDYFPGSYWNTMAQALRHGWDIETRKKAVEGIPCSNMHEFDALMGGK